MTYPSDPVEVRGGHKWDDQRQKQYIAILDERDEAIERAEAAEAKLADYRKWWRQALITLACALYMIPILALFFVVVYAASFILPV